MTNVKEIIDDITNKWFLREPFLFSMFCTHRLVENDNMDCCIRSGKMRIEYNSSRLTAYSRDEIDNLLRREVLRIILKHPYQRQPVCVVPKLAYLASNLTIFLHGGTGINPVKLDIYNLLLDHIQNTLPSFEELYRILLKCGVNKADDNMQNHNGEDPKHNDSYSKKSSPLHNINGERNEINEQNEINEGDDDKENSETRESPSDSDLTSGSFSENSSENDEYDNQKGDSEEKGVSCSLKDIDANQSNTGDGENIACRQTPDSGIDESKDATALWEDNPLFSERINCSILETDDKNWGTLVGNIQSLIKVSTKRAENLLRRLEMFRMSILSTGQSCTRMRPSRRYGWVQMGKLHPYCSRLLLGIDTSGSIEDDDLRKFFSIINSFFSVGFPEIDVLMFDHTIHLPVVKLSSAKDTVKVVGRGGTDFTDVLEYYKDNRQYDGLIMFTDGYADLPVVPKGRKVLWALKDRVCYEYFKLQPKIYLPD